MGVANEDLGSVLRRTVDSPPVSSFDDGGWHYDSSADPFAGGTARGHPIWNVDMIDANLNRTGQSWYVNQNGELNDNTLFYGFWKSADQLQSSYYVSDDGTLAFAEANPDTFSPFTAGQMDAARKAIGLWDDIAAIRFQETTNVSKADITYGNTDTGPASQAYAYLPFGDIYNSYYEPIGFSDINKLGGDVWVNNTIASNFSPLGDSYYATLTLIHETGHALGFSHPGDYNAGDGQELTYDLADYYQDSLQYTVMSYWDAYETGAQHIDWSLDNFVYAATPLVHDISAIQAIYGADMTTRTGDTVYGFNSNADRDAYHFDINTRPVVSIWDAGGKDTLDFSGWNTPSVINLTPGEFSSGGGIEQFLTLDEINANRAAIGFAPRSQATFDFYEDLKAQLGLTNGLYKDNISIGYGVTIENAIGGGGNDLITGNDVANVLTGNGGDDTLIGGLGNDTLIGGSGADMFFFGSAGTTGQDKISDFGKSDVLVTDKAINDKNNDGRITFSGSTVSLDTGANADKVTLVGIAGSSGLRYLGAIHSDFYYGDATVRPTAEAGQRIVEGTVGNDAFVKPSSNITKQVYFFDTASVAPLGVDTIQQFTTRDILVTTARLTDSNNDDIIKFGDKSLDFSSGEKLSFVGSAKAVDALEFDGQVSHGGAEYFVYSLVGSPASIADLHF